MSAMRLTLCKELSRETRPNHNTGILTTCPTLCDKSVGLLTFNSPLVIGNCRNVRGLGKSMVYSIERSTKFESLYQE